MASALSLFWVVVNVTIGFNVQESSSSNLAIFFKVVLEHPLSKRDGSLNRQKSPT